MVHLDEITLELFALQSDSVKSRRKEIARHLRECEGCAALHAEIESYYTQVEMLQREQAKKASQALYAVERLPRASMFRDGAPVAPVRRTVPQRFVASFRQYPARWSVGFAAVVALLVFLVPKFVPLRDRAVALARAEEGFMVVYDDQRNELWRKHVGLDIDERWLPGYLTTHESRGFPVRDVDGDGRNEVFGVFGWANWNAQDNRFIRSVVCFNADGSERWRYELHRNISLRGVPFSDDYRFYQVMVDDFDHSGRLQVIGMASQIPWFPNVIVSLDAQDGTLLGEYWHNGMLPWTGQMDIDADGVEELFLAGQNNRLQQACLVVLDPRAMTGHGPAPPDQTPDGVPPGREKFYILLPGSDLKSFWTDITNEVTSMNWRSDSTLEVVVLERVTAALQEQAKTPKIEEGTLYFYFDTAMRCVRVRASDTFSGIRAKYRHLGLVKGDIDVAYLERLRQGVRYWDGEKFVAQPLMNKRYQEANIRR